MPPKHVVVNAQYCKLGQSVCRIGAIERVMADCIAVLALTAIVLQLAGALTEPSCPVKQGKEQKTLTRVMYASYLLC